MSHFPRSIQKLIDEFSRLPGIGPKSAQRLAMHLLHSPDMRLREFSEAVSGLKTGIQFCHNCWNISESDSCRICADPSRDQRQICVVEEILDVVALEKTREFKGTYHVLHGVLSPVDGIGPEQIKVQAFMDRIHGLVGEDAVPGELESGGEFGLERRHGGLDGVERVGNFVEVILATNPGLEGETTALYLLKLLKPFENVRVTRIARGLPMGGDIDYADEMTLTRALQGRVEYV